jgi:hypothetical protein
MEEELRKVNKNMQEEQQESYPKRKCKTLKVPS